MIIDDRARFFLQVAEKLPKAFNSTASRIFTAAKKALKLGLFSCERRAIRCVNRGKNEEKVRNATVRLIGICRSIKLKDYSLFFSPHTHN